MSCSDLGSRACSQRFQCLFSSPFCKVVKFRADGDEKEWSKETLGLKAFPTVVLFPKGRSGYVKLGSERRDPDSLNTFVTAIVGQL